jgi:hypothetical protein
MPAQSLANDGLFAKAGRVRQRVVGPFAPGLIAGKPIN